MLILIVLDKVYHLEVCLDEMDVFAEKQFRRWAAKESIRDHILCLAAQEVSMGQVEADLGGYLFKKRVAKAGSGKSSGYRTILGFRKSTSSRIFYLYGFPKNERGNISQKERLALSAVARSLLEATDRQIEELVAKNSISQLECEHE